MIRASDYQLGPDVLHHLIGSGALWAVFRLGVPFPAVCVVSVLLRLLSNEAARLSTGARAAPAPERPAPDHNRRQNWRRGALGMPTPRRVRRGPLVARCWPDPRRPLTVTPAGDPRW